MSASHSLRAYDDCIDLFDRALRASSGIEVQCPDHGAANQLRTRLNYCRKLLRLQSMEIYTHGEPEYGISPYETLYITVRNDTLFIRKRSSTSFTIGEIEEITAASESGAS